VALAIDSQPPKSWDYLNNTDRGPSMSNSHKLLLASVALCTITSTAFAADLPTKKGPPPAPVAAPFSWTGFNVGLQGGFGWGVEHDNLSVTDFELAGDQFSASSVLGGVHVGYDQQFGSFVLGVRGEFDASDLHGATTAAHVVSGGSCVEGCTVTVASLAFRNTWQAFLLGRAGFAFDRLLVYATGGLAIADDQERIAASEGFYNSYPGTPTEIFGVWTGSQTKTLVGGAIGLGAEYALGDHWSFGAEWRYANFGKGDYSAVSSLKGQPTVNYKAGFSENLALVDLSYRF
jgi:outer membrane immunogenic protein